MNIWTHIKNQPFIFTTGLAALIHSTWTLGTLFGGTEPNPQFTGSWFAWIIPAALIAFALDVGQIVTSAEIRAGERTRAKYLTFLIFAAATYYLQWLYMAHHMPVVELAPGMRQSWADAAGLLRDAAVWIIPALLPMSTALYTFSYSKAKEMATVKEVLTVQPDAGQLPKIHLPVTAANVTVDQLQDGYGTEWWGRAVYYPFVAHKEVPALPANAPIAIEPAPVAESRYRFKCPDCGFDKNYDNLQSVTQASRTHNRQCKPRLERLAKAAQEIKA